MLDDIEKVFKLYFDLQIEESTVIKGTAHALELFRFINENQIANLFLCSSQLTELLQRLIILILGLHAVFYSENHLFKNYYP